MNSNPVEDIRPGSGGSGPDVLIDMGAYVLFRADDGVHGREWWRSDGLTDTRLLKDIQPGAASGLLNTTGTSDVARFGEVLVFAADNGTDGTELWRTDGTEAGTYQVAALQPSGSGGSPASFAMMGDRIYFSAYGGFTTGRELYAIDASAVAGDDVLPVELVGFKAQQDGTSVRLAWQTASETNNAGFHVERQRGATWTRLGFVEGHGTTEAPQSYRFTDEALPFAADRLTYRLRQVDFNGTTTYSSKLTVERETPTQLKVYAPFPNPAHGERITLRYELPDGRLATDVQVTLYDVRGRVVAALPTQRPHTGRAEVELRLPAALGSGLYFVRLTAGDHTRTRRLIVVR
jgi:ELWxxDGT repeat protein